MEENIEYIKDKNNKDKIGETNNQQNCELIINIIGFFEKDILIKEAKKYEVKLKNNITFNYFSNIISALSKIDVNNNLLDILINDISIKNNLIVNKYLQQNCLILSQKTAYLNNNLSVLDNIKIVSLLFAGFDLSNATISSFNMKEIELKKVYELSQEQKQILILSYCIACPELIWIIDKKLLKNLTQEQIEIFDNAVNIRIKHGGVVMIVDEE